MEQVLQKMACCFHSGPSLLKQEEIEQIAQPIDLAYSAPLSQLHKLFGIPLPSSCQVEVVRGDCGTVRRLYQFCSYEEMLGSEHRTALPPKPPKLTQDSGVVSRRHISCRREFPCESVESRTQNEFEHVSIVAVASHVGGSCSLICSSLLRSMSVVWI